uniref:Uncharacterized protein n=1 Tax=Arion vulgaris TaxID=1028688 RepID=A0A0B7BFZ3_9EUPU
MRKHNFDITLRKKYSNNMIPTKNLLQTISDNNSIFISEKSNCMDPDNLSQMAVLIRESGIPT